MKLSEKKFYHASRFTLLMIVCFATLACNYAHNVVAILINPLKAHFSVDNSKFGLLYSFYELPNSVLPLFGGAALSRLGINYGMLSVLVVSLLGAILVAAAVPLHSFVVLLIGRTVYGAGAELAYVALDTWITIAFENAELSFAYGMVTSSGRLGDTLAYSFAPILQSLLGGFSAPLWFAAILLASGYVASHFFVVWSRSRVQPLVSRPSRQSSAPVPEPEVPSDVAYQRLDDAPPVSNKPVSSVTDTRGPHVVSISVLAVPAGPNTTLPQPAFQTRTSPRIKDHSASPATPPSHRRPPSRSPALGSLSSSLQALSPSMSPLFSHFNLNISEVDNFSLDGPAPTSHHRIEPYVPPSHTSTDRSVLVVGKRTDEDRKVGAESRVVTSEPEPEVDMSRRDSVESHTPSHVGFLEAVKAMPALFWITCITIAAYSSCFFTFLGFAPDYLQSSPLYGLTQQQAGNAISIVCSVSMFISPFLGGLVDRLGHRPLLCAVSLSFCLTSMICLEFISEWTGSTPPLALSLVALAIGSSVFTAAVWPILPLVVLDPRLYSHCYSFASAIINSSLLLSFSAVGHLSASAATRGYRGVFILFATLILLAMFLSFVILWADKRQVAEEHSRLVVAEETQTDSPKPNKDALLKMSSWTQGRLSAPSEVTLFFFCASCAQAPHGNLNHDVLTEEAPRS